MAIAFVKNVLASQQKATLTGNGGAIAVSAAPSAGNLLVARVSAIHGTQTSSVSTIADTKGNTWNVVTSIGVSGTDDCSIVYTFQDVGKLTTSDTVTVSWAGGLTCKGLVLIIDEFSGAGSLDSTKFSASDGTGTAPNIGLTFTPSSIGCLLVGAVAVAGVIADTYTQDTANADGDTWHALTRLATSGGGATSNVTLNGAYKVITSLVSEDYKPTITSRDWFDVLASFLPSSPATPRTPVVVGFATERASRY